MTTKIINDKIAKKAKLSLMRLKSHGTTANKLKALIAANKHGVKKVSEIFNVGRTSIYRWADELNKEGFKYMINDSKHHEGIKLKDCHKSEINKWLNKDPNLSILTVKNKLLKEFDLIVSKSTVHRAMKSCGFSYITPRKNHYKQDKKEVDIFKKNSNQK